MLINTFIHQSILFQSLLIFQHIILSYRIRKHIEFQFK
jgi:hypothetical protein